MYLRILITIVLTILPITNFASLTTIMHPERKITLRGVVTCEPKRNIPATGILIIKLEDINTNDNENKVVAVETIDLNERGFPISFNMTFDASKLNQQNSYLVNAALHDTKGRILLLSSLANPIDLSLTRQDLGKLKLTRPTAARSKKNLHNIFMCGDIKIDTFYEGDEILLKIGDSITKIKQDNGQSGLYQGKSSKVGDINFWYKDDRGLLDINNVDYPVCHLSKQIFNVDELENLSITHTNYKAHGHAPDWHLKINNNRLTVTPPDGKNITLSKPTFERLNNERRFSAEDHRHKVTIEVAKTVCLDQIKNRLYPDTVTLSIDDKKYTGCGGKPDFLLMEKNWAISSVGGKQINERSHLNLTFLPNGRITGDSGCNQFGGTYNLTQNGISISLLHITRKICINSLMQQEFNFLKLISKTSDYIVEEKNKLILKSGNGDIVAYSRDD